MLRNDTGTRLFQKNVPISEFAIVKSNDCSFASRKFNCTVRICWTQSKTPPETIFKSLA